jgi:FlaA1/EpsC-like NDP-sugar epimerase
MKDQKVDAASSYDELLSSFVYNRRLILDSLAIAVVDLFMMTIALIMGNLILLWANDIPFSIVNGWLLLPSWLVFCISSKLIPGWGLGSADELRKIERTLFILFASILIISFLTRENIASSRIVFLFTFLLAAVLVPLGRFGIRALLVSQNRWGLPVTIYGGGGSWKIVLEC